MQYPETFSTKLSRELAVDVRAYASQFECGESAVLRLAVKEFFSKPRDRVRIRAPKKPRALLQGGVTG